MKSELDINEKQSHHKSYTCNHPRWFFPFFLWLSIVKFYPKQLFGQKMLLFVALHAEYSHGNPTTERPLRASKMED